MYVTNWSTEANTDGSPLMLIPNDTLFHLHFDGEPLKLRHWYLFVCLFLFIIWNTFTTFYFSRIIGPVLAFILTRLYRLKGSNVYFSLGSFSISLLSGKVMFRNFYYTCCDYSIRCNDGWVQFRYWAYVAEKPSARGSLTSRVSVALNGLQIHVFNRLSEYKRLAKYFGFERLFKQLKKQPVISIPRQLTEKEEQAWDNFYDKLWCLIGYIKLSIGSGKFLAGNSSLPSTFVIIYENFSCTEFEKKFNNGYGFNSVVLTNFAAEISLKARKTDCDRALLCITGNCENLSVSFVRTPAFDRKQHSGHFTGRRDPPPRTMGDGFAILQTARVYFFYNQSILGIVQDEVQSTTENQPIWESIWRFGKNTVFSYGPWADSQRILIYNFFFPPDHFTSSTTVMPRRGHRRIFLAHDVRVNVLNDAGFDIWFMRGDELNALHLRFKHGSSIDLNIPWVIEKNGYSTILRCCLLCVDSSTSLSYSKFFQCETFRLSLIAHYPRVFNAHQLWKYKIELSKFTMWFIWDHKRFFSDLISEWSFGPEVDLFTFIPYTWDFSITVTDSFELIFVLNDKNWIDTKLADTSQNALVALVAKEVRLNFFMPFVSFCPETVNLPFEIKGKGPIALRIWLPPFSPMLPVMQTLVKNSPVLLWSSLSAGLPTFSSLAEGWIEVFHSNEVKFLFDYVYHPVYVEHSSDLPYNVVTTFLPKITSNPMELLPDELLIECTVGESEFLLFGTVIKMISDLKDNYFGIFDQVSEVGSTKTSSDSQRSQKIEKLLTAEELRPLNLRFCLRFLKPTAHCAIHRMKNSAECPVLKGDELVVELVKKPFEVLVQLNLGRAVMQFSNRDLAGDSFLSDSFLSLETLSVRANGLYSEIDVPLDIGTIEYAWLTEIVIGSVCGALTAEKALSLYDFLGSLVFMFVSPDEELMVPEKYQLCQHFNDIYACPHSALCLIDGSGKIQNCESEENLKYKLFRLSVDDFSLNFTDDVSITSICINPLRLSYCNCHEASFCEEVTIKMPMMSVKQYVRASGDDDNCVCDVWLECTSISLQNLKLDVLFPYSQENIHLFQERRVFLMKHDKSTSRLNFLWDDRKKSCACFGNAHFFAKKDTLGEVFMNEYFKCASEYKRFKNAPLQPAIEQSIIYPGKSVFSLTSKEFELNCYEVFANRCRGHQSSNPVVGDFTVSNFKWCRIHGNSEESFHSAVSSSSVKFLDEMSFPILSSGILCSSYANFLRSGNFKLLDDNGVVPSEQLSSTFMGPLIFEELSPGVNQINVSNMEKKRVRQSKSLSPFSTSPSSRCPSTSNIYKYGTDKFTLYIRGSVATSLQIFLTPLSIEVFERFLNNGYNSLLTVSSSLLMFYIYASCSFFQHRQPLTLTQNRGLKEKQLIFCDISLPDIKGTFFQCGLCDDADQTDHPVKLSNTVTTVNIRKSLVLEEVVKYCIDWEHLNLSVQMFDFGIADKTDHLSSNTLSSPHLFDDASSLGLIGNLDQYGLRNITGIGVNDISVYINSGPNASQQLSSDVNYAQLIVGSVELCCELCHAPDKRKRWLFREALTSSVASWVSSVYRLTNTLNKRSLEYDHYLDIEIIKLLIAVLGCDEEKVFIDPYNCFSEVSAKRCPYKSCPTCLLSLTLLRYLMDIGDSKLSDDFGVSYTTVLEVERKQAIIALLSRWQTVISQQVEFCEVDLTKKYVEDAYDTKKEVWVHMEDENNKAVTSSNGERSSRSTGESQQMDLYHWISARRKEHKEAYVKVSGNKRTLDDFTPIDPMKISLLAFFWPIFNSRKLVPLEFSKFPFESLKLLFSLELAELKVDLAEPRLVSSSALNYLSVVKNCLFNLESVNVEGHVQAHVHFDDKKLRPIRFTAETSHTTNIQNTRLALSWTSVYFLRDIALTVNLVRALVRHVASICSVAKPSVHETAESLASPLLYSYCSGIENLLSKLDATNCLPLNSSVPKFNPCTSNIKFDGNFVWKLIMLEMAFTQLFLSATLKKFEVLHKVLRERHKSGNVLLDEVTATVQRANLILSELVSGLDAKHILNSSVNTSTFYFKRIMNDFLHNFLNIHIGDIEGDIPMHAENLREVVLRNVPKLNEQITLLEDNQAKLKENKHFITAEVTVNVNSIEFDVLILPSLKAKYRLDKAEGSGKTQKCDCTFNYSGPNAKFFVEVKSHIVSFTVLAHGENRKDLVSSDTFSLPLPFITAQGNYRLPISSAENGSCIPKYYEGGYYDIDLIVGKMDYVITTDLLNQVLFAEQCFRSELSIFLDRLTGSHVMPNTTSAKELKLPSLLYTIQIRGEAYPWLQLTACTPTATALRITCGNITANLTNRWVRKDLDDKTVLERLYGKAVINLSAKLGQLVKTAMFEEIETELQEYATFTTQISFQNKDSNVHSSYNYVITVNRPILLIKSTAIDKTVEPDMNISLSLKVTNGAYVCMPLYNSEISANMSALVISLKSTDITVCVRKELACQAAFHNFKVQFMDNFDEQALNEDLLEKDPSDLSRSNYFFFPEGTYQFVSQATDVGPNNEHAKWTLSVKWQMLGMIIDLDHRIGKLASLLVRTFSSMATGEDDDVWDGSARGSVSFVSNDESDREEEVDTVEGTGTFPGSEDKIETIERKMHEQSILVMDLMQCGATETTIEQERRKLRKLEVARSQIFRKSVLKRLKHNHHKDLVVNKNEVSAKVCSGFTKTHARKSSSGSATLLAVDLSHNQSASRLSDAVPETFVDMDIDVQISVESGSCTLRGVAKQEDHSVLIKRPSARDLRTKSGTVSETTVLTRLAIPNVDVKAYYTSLDNFSGNAKVPRQFHLKFPHKSLKQSSKKKPAFYLAVELSSMPQESLITPSLADYLEQLLEPFPHSNFFESTSYLSTKVQDGDGSSEVPIVEMDTSSLPIDVLFHLVVQSSTVRFEGQQVRSAAADCLLKLPSMTLIASTKPLIELPTQSEIVNQEICGSGVHLSATLNAFSLNVYSPHQKSTTHDALSLTLDKLCLVMSRTKNAKNEQNNKVQFVLTANIGSANFNYDMRRLAELISFPKPWYRKTIMRRLFFGEHSFKNVEHSPSTASCALPVSCPGSAPPPSPVPISKTVLSEPDKKKDWSAKVLFALEWKEFDISAQMANTMGNTKLIVRNGILQGFCQLDSKTEKNVWINFRLKPSSLIAHGGAISGQVAVSEFDFSCTHKSAYMKTPENKIKMKLNEVECRVEWMSRTIFIGHCLSPSIIIQDEWTTFTEGDNINRVTVSLNMSCSFEDMQMVITKVTMEDFVKISDKLQSFFKEQLSSSRRVWGIQEDPLTIESNEQQSQDSKSLEARRRYRHWPDVLDSLTEIQTKFKIISMPVDEHGVTTAGGSIEFNAGHISLACMSGEMNATSWALFYMQELTVIFNSEAQYSFISSNNDVGVLVSQRVTWKLGELSALQQDKAPEFLALVCRVQQGRGSMMRQTSSVSAFLDHMIGDVLRKLKLYPQDSTRNAAHHFVLPLFQFPAFDAVFTSVQKQETDIDDAGIITPEVRSSLICEFHDTVNVQTDFNAQVSFLPELLKTYMKNDNRTAEEKAADINHDFRRYVCEVWRVDPRIRFIDRFKWNPPVIDEILRKLQIFDHRMTIPKALQRGILDPCDALLAQIHSSVLVLAKKTYTKPKELDSEL
uniref:FSA_C domain-containing protein n=1 Tax=Syphacia muris TaxID=451379 RepID=A0A158R4Y4_9BILA